MQASDGVEAGAQPSSRRPPPLRRSCEHCRICKIRCLPVDNLGEKKCQRCVRDGKDCVFAPAQQRARKTVKFQMRVAEMEKKLDGMFALLSNKERTPVPDSSPSTGLPAAARSGSVPNQRDPRSTMSSPQGNAYDPCRDRRVPQHVVNLPTPSPSVSNIPNYRDIIDRGKIPYKAAQVYLQRYRTHAAHYPFVIVPPYITVEQLRRDRPFALLAIITMGAALNSPDQEHAELELREQLGNRFMVHGEKSLDLLQGLLIYLTWYHKYFKPERQQAYQLLQLAMAMAVDLGITKLNPTRDGAAGDPPHPIDAKLCKPAVFPSIPQAEAQRTLLGCYYTAVTMSCCLRKQNLFHWTPYMDDCVAYLAEANEAPRDSTLGHYLAIQRLADDVSDAFGYDGSRDSKGLCGLQIELYLRSFQTRASQIRHSFTQECFENAPLMNNYHYLNMYIHEIGLYSTLSTTVPDLKDPPPPPASDWRTSPVRTNTIIAFFSHANNLLSGFLAMPWTMITKQTSHEITRIIICTALLGFALTHNLEAPSLSQEDINRAIDLMDYLERLSSLIGEHLTVIDGEVKRDMYWQFKAVFDTTKARVANHGKCSAGAASRSAADCVRQQRICTSSYGVDTDETMGTSEQVVPQQDGFGNGGQAWEGMEAAYSMGEELPALWTEDTFWSELMSGWPPTMDTL